MQHRSCAIIYPAVFWVILAPMGGLLFEDARAIGTRGTVIEDFESGGVVLDSYPGQDSDPADWEIVSDNTFGDSAYALRLYGNSWKTEDITPVALTDTTVWQVAVHAERLGEMQALGLSDGINELLYTFSGEQLPEGTQWWTVYQGSRPRQEWHLYLLPVGRDWQVTHGYLPEISQLIYVNDDDDSTPTLGATLFDEILDVTGDLPVEPQVQIQYTIDSSVQLAKHKYRVGVQFYGKVFDPDSETHTFRWDFGDSTTSSEQNPLHQFIVTADHTYTVGLVATDPDRLAGLDTCQVPVEPGEAQLPITVNFVGDVFTGRSYESPGGIIDTHGIEALFEPTLPILGQAADVSVANMEVCYTDQGTPHPTKSVVFRSRPENISGLAFAGIDVVDIGNNHIIDYGEEGMLQCLGLLDGLNIPYCGAGTSEYFALQPCFRTEQGVRIAFLGQCNRTGRQWNYQPFLDAGASKPGFAYLIPHNLQASLAAVRDQADIVVIQLHSGDEYEHAPPPDGKQTNSGGWTAPPRVEAAAIHPDDPEFRFRTEPTPGDRELRRLAADLGADVVINHHPHVLQGFESYHGKLIAHSLGNFIFDLYYPETMPTLVLTLEMDKQGISGYRFVPAWIDDYIPQPATGQLGREIMDRLADYSRPLNAVVAVNPAENLARIHLERADLDSVVTDQSVDTWLVDAAGYRVSPPVLLTGEGNLSGILAVTGDVSGGWEVCWGREILWHGGFEAEGATFWQTNTDDEWLDDSEAHTGQRALALRRDDGDGEPVGTDLEKHLPCDPAQRHTCCGWLKADNAKAARIMARFYETRYASNPLSSTDLADPVTGSQDWTFQWRNLDTPGHGTYFEVRCDTEAPAAGTGHVWFDDLAFVEWEPWQAVDGPLAIPSPNNFRYLQVRNSQSGTTTATITYSETTFDQALAGLIPQAIPPRRFALRNFPNPFNPRTTIELSLPASSIPLNIELTIHDVRGRLVRTIFHGPLTGGTRHGITWDGKDARGQPVASGVYFARAVLGTEKLTHKLLLLR